MLTVAVALPMQLPLHFRLAVTLAVTGKGVAVSTTDAVEVLPQLSVTVMIYVAAHKPVAVAVVCPLGAQE
jgi:hypothetical protein